MIELRHSEDANLYTCKACIILLERKIFSKYIKMPSALCTIGLSMPSSFHTKGLLLGDLRLFSSHR